MTRRHHTPPQRRPVPAAALAVVLALGGLSFEAQALWLGRASVQSLLGEPLRAQIDVPEITPQEAQSLRAGPAPAAAYQQAGLAYDEAVAELRISLQRRPNGRAYLQVSGQRPLNTPFVELVLQASWAGGQITQGYTLLLEPAPPAATDSPINLPRVAASAQPSASPLSLAPQASPGRQAAGAKPATITANPGMTASELAASHLPPAVSLEQMLVALLEANPEAFAGGNVNRLLAGAELKLPSAAQAQRVTQDQARQALAAQSRDFDVFRQQLAQQAQPAAAAAPAPPASATLQPPPSSASAQPALPDKLTLSKGAVSTAAEAQLAQEQQAAQDKARLAELSSNIQALEKIARQAADVAAASSPPPGATGSAAEPQLALPNLPALPATAAATGLVKQLIHHPAVLPTTGGLLALMAALAWWRTRLRRSTDPILGLPTEQDAPTPAGKPDPAAPDHTFNPALHAQLLAELTGAAGAQSAPPPAASPVAAPPAYFDLDLSLGDEAPLPASMQRYTPDAPAVQTAFDLAPDTGAAAAADPLPTGFDLEGPKLDLSGLSLDLGEPAKPDKAPS